MHAICYPANRVLEKGRGGSTSPTTPRTRSAAAASTPTTAPAPRRTSGNGSGRRGSSPRGAGSRRTRAGCAPSTPASRRSASRPPTSRPAADRAGRRRPPGGAAHPPRRSRGRSGGVRRPAAAHPPAMSVETSFPILSVADLPRSLRFYGDLLGGEIDYRFPEEGEPQFVTLKLGSSTIGLGATTGGGGDGAGYTLCAYVPESDAAVERIRAPGTRSEGSRPTSRGASASPASRTRTVRGAARCPSVGSGDGPAHTRAASGRSR